MGREVAGKRGSPKRMGGEMEDTSSGGQSANRKASGLGSPRELLVIHKQGIDQAPRANQSSEFLTNPGTVRDYWPSKLSLSFNCSTVGSKSRVLKDLMRAFPPGCLVLCIIILEQKRDRVAQKQAERRNNNK